MVAEQVDPTAAAALQQPPEPSGLDVNVNNSDDEDILDDIEALRTMIETLREEVKELTKRKDTIDSIRGYDSKNIKKPAEWSGDKSEYTVRHVLFTTYLATFDKQWKSILKNILKFGSGKMSCEDVRKFWKQITGLLNHHRASTRLPHRINNEVSHRVLKDCPHSGKKRRVFLGIIEMFRCVPQASW